MNSKNESKMRVYVPNGAKINKENISASPPSTMYEESRKTVDQEVVKKVVKGKYGKEDKN